jgi:hypothetical protein
MTAAMIANDANSKYSNNNNEHNERLEYFPFRFVSLFISIDIEFFCFSETLDISRGGVT